MKKSVLLFVFFSLFNLSSFSQNALFDWAKRIGGTGIDVANDNAVDASGNVYYTGYFNGTVNFNPGGAYNLTSAGQNDIFVSKLDASGNFVWAFKLGSTTNDVGYSIALDASNNVYVTGSFRGTVNFNPAGTFNLTAAGSDDIFIAKYDATGAFLWAKRIGGTSVDVAYSIAVDASANVYTTGYYIGTVNFNPGGTFNMTSNSSSADMFVSKLDAAGNFVMAKSTSGAMTEIGYGIAVDASSNIYVTGFFEDVVDFDPNAGTATFVSVGMEDMFLLKLTSVGNYSWAKAVGGMQNDEGASVVADASGNVYCAGRFDASVSFGATNFTTYGINDAFVTKLDASGAFLWAKQFGSTAGDAAYAVTLDGSGNVYTTGYFSGTVDFNPNAGTNNLTSYGSADVYISKLDNSGNYVWAKQMGGTGFDSGSSLNVISSGHVYTVGSFNGTSNFSTEGTFNLTSAGSNDIFVQRLKPCVNTSHTMNVTACLSYTLNAQTYTTSGTYVQNLINAGGCDSTLTINLRISNMASSIASQTNVNCFGAASGSASVTATGGILPYSYSWTPSGGTAATASGLTAGSYTCTITDSIGCIKTQIVTITQPAQALGVTVSTTNASCMANGSATANPTGGTTPYSYSWTSGDITQTAPGLMAGTYTVTVTDYNGCTALANGTITNSIQPAAPDICMVTVDGQSINNIIYWDRTLYPTADSFVVFREVSTAIYKRIGAVSVDSVAQYIDTARSVGPANGDPNVGSYRYKLQVRDTCGNYSPLSLYHNTIYIIDAGLGQFTWSIPYTIEGGANPVANYILLCDTANVDVWSPVATVSGTQSSATDPGFVNHSAIANWRVKTAWSITCDPTRATINTTRSNIKRGMVTNITEVLNNVISLYPNPATGIVTIQMPQFKQPSSIVIYNAVGQEVNRINTSQMMQEINISEFAPGIYTVAVQTQAGQVFKKLVIQ